MNDSALLGPWVRRFLLEHLVAERNLARNTQRSYRDALSLLIPFVADKLNRSVDRLNVVDLSADLVRCFLADLEQARQLGRGQQAVEATGNQHGNPDTDCRDIYTGERVTGPATLSQAQLAANRADYLGDVLAHPLNDSFYRDRTPDLSKIEYPALVIANWGGLGLHLRGTIRGYMGIASREKWLKIQSGSYFHTFLHRGT